MNTPPSSSTAAHWNSPAAAATMLDSCAMANGVAGMTAPITPSRPAPFAPQVVTLRPDVTPRLTPSPAETASSGSRESTSTAAVGAGDVQYSGVDAGTRPLPSPPHPMTLPLVSITSV